MKKSVRLFAAAKELAGADDIEVDLKDGATIADLRRAIEKDYPRLGRILPQSLWAVDAAYASDDAQIGAESEVAMIPPVSGG
jgi:molybdopterin converting factor small subunit